MNRFIRSACSFALIVFCSFQASNGATAHTQEAVVPMKPGSETVAPRLAGTTWRLIKIMSMDDNNYVPENSSKYTLELNTDGNSAIQAGCNHAIGTWQSEYPGQLQFRLIDRTRISCPMGSLSDRYLSQFEWIRSYVIKDSHLFLATMADGSIIEFEPLARLVAATVFGEEVHANDATELQQVILSLLFDQYITEHGLEASKEEIDSHVEHLEHVMAADPNLTTEDDLTSEEATQVEAIRRRMGRSLIRQWKLNRALYRQYGGRVIYQQLGPEPLDAYRQFLEERQTKGDFTIHEQAFEDRFWRYFTDDSIHTFYEAGSEAEAFESPPW